MEIFAQLVAYGTAGAGVSFGILAYRLLNREQEKPEPHKDMLREIRFYMAYSIVLVLIGAGVEISKNYIISVPVPGPNLACNAESIDRISEKLIALQANLSAAGAKKHGVGCSEDARAAAQTLSPINKEILGLKR